MTIGDSPQTSNSIVGKRLKLTVAEPDVFAQSGDDIVYGVVARVLTLTNDRGDPYEIAVVELDRPLAYGVHSSKVISLMTRYGGKELADLLRGERVVVNIVLEDPWVLQGDASDPRMSDKNLGFYLGYGTATVHREA